MINIYQLFPRLFGNASPQQLFDGTIEENGCGKFSGITQQAIEALRTLGITHIWLTGIIRHAKITSYAEFEVPDSHPSLVKGRAGSPYAIADYYDVDPDLAVDVTQRMSEFEQLVARIHSAGLKVLIDFVPNHVARQYRSVAKPDGVHDLGCNDDTSVEFHPQNNFYYLPGRTFLPPQRTGAIYQTDAIYVEQPAKVTGNDCFSASPEVTDWFETVKLNYGVNYSGFMEQHFNPIPDTWHKMLHILRYWADKGVDGFRADMAEMVPLAFWEWAIRQLKETHPHLLMIAEVYQPGRYHDFAAAGFDFLYDKVGLYDKLMNILRHQHAAQDISECWRKTEGLNNRMLRFLENHDEVRLASRHTGLQPLHSLPAMAVAAFMHPSALLIYNGQESGETATGASGFSGDDGRTSIYDYCIMPQHQQWYNNGNCDGAMLSYDQKLLRLAFQKMLMARLTMPALKSGAFYDLMWANPWFTNFDPQYVFAFLRYCTDQKIIVLANFNKSELRSIKLKIPEDAFRLMGFDTANLPVFEFHLRLGQGNAQQKLDGSQIPSEGCTITIPPSNFAIFELVTPS
ncbi:MAG TPA: alpha-amylase family protein [Bacteroidales bacterium]|nr:alpha-amylase family protein [Bacteroidales bacterium]